MGFEGKVLPGLAALTENNLVTKELGNQLFSLST